MGFEVTNANPLVRILIPCVLANLTSDYSH